MMRAFGLLLGILLTQNVSVVHPGEWSRLATPLDTVPLDGTVRPQQKIVAHDGRAAILFKDGELFLVTQEPASGSSENGVPVEILAEVGWSDDSKAVFVTASDGGSVGTWDTYVLQIKGPALLKVLVTEQARKDFTKRYTCDKFGETGSQAPNFGAITWTKDSNELLILAEVPPVSTCPQSLIMGYKVAVPSGTIVGSYTEKELRSRWGRELGTRHRKAKP